MFRKLTTFIDSRLRSLMGEDSSIAESRGFGECMALTATIVNIATGELGKVRTQLIDWESGDRSKDVAGNNFRIAVGLDATFEGITGGRVTEFDKLRQAVAQSSRLEVVVDFYMNNHFVWTLSAFKKGEKEASHSICFVINFLGVVCPSQQR